MSNHAPLFLIGFQGFSNRFLLPRIRDIYGICTGHLRDKYGVDLKKRLNPFTSGTYRWKQLFFRVCF